MSVTQTLALSSKVDCEGAASTSTILMTHPQKRKRLSPEADIAEGNDRRSEGLATASSQMLRSKILECRHNTVDSPAELFRWTFAQAAIAPVRVKHVFEMDIEHGHDEFYWMGRVPCRTVKVVGIVVGIDEFDDMTRFKLDDGTAVIDCDFKHPKQLKQPSTPKARRTKPTSKYDLPENLKPLATKRYMLPLRLDVPKVFVGTIISVQGRIFRGRGSRYLRVETGNFSICNSANDEPRHWMEVVKLYREYYNLLEPFTIPKIASQPDSVAAPPTIPSSLATPSSPVSASSPSGAESSPARSSTSSPQQPRLRHPSRLHSRDLTDVTFRIYLKHYMDFAPPFRPFRGMLIDDDDDDDDSVDFGGRCSTPTPKSRHRPHSSLLETPRPRDYTRTMISTEDEDEEGVQYGFTLSYLRRVPVLAEMARGVVRAEGKRREREKRKREKEKGTQRTQGFSSATASSSKSTASSASHPEMVSRNMKRLFQKTIRDLYKDGSIVLWSGPTRPCEYALHADDGHGNSIGDSIRLWKAGSKEASLPSSFSTTSSSTVGRLTQEESMTDELSEPDEREEAYLPVTAQTIAPHVMRGLRIITGVQSSARMGWRRYRSPTVDELTLHLQHSDAQWTNLGSWDVKAALEWLQKEERVFKAGDGRWAVCI